MTLLDPIGWAVLFLLLGCALIVLEVFLPSGGAISFFAILALVASIVMAFRRDLATGTTFLAVTLIAVPAVVGLAFKYWPRTPMGRAFLGELPSEEETKPNDARRQLLGKVGVAKSKMLPSGAVLVEGQMVDAVSRSGAIEFGQAVVVIEVSANRVVVRAADTDEAAKHSVDEQDVLSRPLEEFGLDTFDEPMS